MDTELTKEQIKNVNQLTYALRSGKYKQAKKRLRSKKKRADGTYGYCCLGVACDLHKNMKGFRCAKSNDEVMPSSDFLTDKFGKKFNGFRYNFAQANDDGKSFAFIADRIDENVLGKLKKRDAKGRFIKIK